MSLATDVTAAASEAGTRLLTVADVAMFPTQLPSGPVDYELCQGALVVMSPPGDPHGALQNRFGAAFLVQGEERGWGTSRTEISLILSRDPDTLYVPDVVFLAKRSYPVRVTREDYWETMPSIVVEVRSKNNTQSELDRKVRDYLAAGVEVVWIADPVKKIVHEHRRDHPVREYTEQDTLTVEDVIPGFALPLTKVFGPLFP